MSFINKYKKYSQKLINQIGGARIDKEIIMSMTPDLYKNVILSEDKKLLTLTRISDNANIRVILPVNYPFNKPQIFINDREIGINEYDITKFITKYLDESLEFNKKVLILCHPELVNGSFEPLTLNNHWWGMLLGDNELPIFNDIFREYNLKGKPKFDTVDIIPGGTFQEDAFNDEFINKHIDDYDLIMVPDCNGPWAELQSSVKPIFDGNRKYPVLQNLTLDEQNDNKTILITLCLNLIKMIKSGGIIVFSKLIAEKPCMINLKSFDTFSSALNYYLNQNGFTTNIKETGMTTKIKYLIAVKA